MPNNVAIQHITPITEAGKKILYGYNARDIPTPSASMLVAKDSITKENPFVGSVVPHFSLSDLKVSFINVKSNIKRIIEAKMFNLDVNSMMSLPMNAPITGIINWKSPKCQPSLK